MARDPAIWFVMIDGQKTGPISRAEIALEFANQTIDGDSYVWKAGMADWQPGAEVAELIAIFATESSVQVPEPPPPPPAAARPRASGAAAAVRSAAAAKPGAAAAAQRPFRRTAFSTGPEDKKKEAKGKGMLEFNTSHFNLDDLPSAEEEKEKKKGLEFDTSHFKLADLPPKGEEHDWSKLTVQKGVRKFKEGVVGYGDSGAAAQGPKGASAAPAPATKEPGDWTKLTVQHEVKKFKEGVNGYADAMAATPEAVKPGAARRGTGQPGEAAEGWKPTAHAGSPKAKGAPQAAPARGLAEPAEQAPRGPAAARPSQPAPAKAAPPRAAQPPSRPRPGGSIGSSGKSPILYVAVGAGTLLGLGVLWLLFG